MIIEPEKITAKNIISALSSDIKIDYAHEIFLPEGRSIQIPSNSSKNIKESAILVLLIESKNGLSLCLTLRNKNLKHHPGYFSDVDPCFGDIDPSHSNWFKEQIA